MLHGLNDKQRWRAKMKLALKVIRGLRSVLEEASIDSSACIQGCADTEWEGKKLCEWLQKGAI